VRIIVGDKLIKNDKSFNYDLCLMSELLDKQKPEPYKIYFEKLNSSQLKYIVLSPAGENIESKLNLFMGTEILTKEFLAYPRMI